MAEVSIQLQCGDCTQESKYLVSDELRGNKLSFTCKHCKKKMKYFFPKERSAKSLDSTGTSFTDQPNVISAYLEDGFRNRYHLIEDENIIGRQSVGQSPGQNGVTISIDNPDKTMSRKHCVIHRKKNSRGSYVYMIRDLKSVNGLVLNNRRINESEELYLCHGDTIELGSTKIKFVEVPAS